ncbi:MAG TPA: hypothetical protein VEK08_08220 [Planctomycetota bacterium]|nr:hypothetical protein [Planctomycetota bacterium]
MNDPDPTEDKWRPRPDAKGKYFNDPLHEGINCVRGQAAEAIGSLLFADLSRLSLLLPTVERLVTDKTTAVRTCAIKSLVAMLNWPELHEVALDLFKKCTQSAESVIGTHWADTFLHHTYRRYYSIVRECMQRALTSDYDKCVTAAATKVALAGFTKDQTARMDAERVRKGTPEMRRGAADVYATNVNDPGVGEECKQFLPALFNDDDPEVQKESSKCFDGMNGDQLRSVGPLIQTFASSKAFAVGSWSLVRALEHSTELLPDAVLAVVGRSVALLKAALPERNYSGLEVDSCAKLILRLYQQSNDGNIRKKCLDIVDEMERMNCYGISSQLANTER